MRDKKNNGTRTQEKKRHSVANSATLEDQCHPRKIFVGGLTHKTTTQHLREHFSRYGSIVDAVVLRWPDGRSRGFGYVTFADVGSASTTLRTTHHIGGHLVDVKRAVPGTNKLFVGGLPQNTTAQELREHFETFGVVSDAVVMIDPATSRSRGFGFICFLPGQEGAAAVSSALEQYEYHHIRGKWIEVKSASPPHRLVQKDGASSTTATDADDRDIGEILAVKGSSARHPEVHPLGAGGRPVASPFGRWGGSDAADDDDGNGDQRPPALGEPQKIALPRAPAAAPRQQGAMIPPAGAATGFYPPHMPSDPWLCAMAAAATAASASGQQQMPPGLVAALAGYYAGLQSPFPGDPAAGAYAALGGASWPLPPPTHTADVFGGGPPGLGALGHPRSQYSGALPAAASTVPHYAAGTGPCYAGTDFLDASPDFQVNLERLLRQSGGQASLYSNH